MMTKLRFALVLSLLVVAVLINSGCRKAESHAKPKVALVMKSLANEFFSTMAEGARQHHAANAGTYELIVNGIKNRDIEP